MMRVRFRVWAGMVTILAFSSLVPIGADGQSAPPSEAQAGSPKDVQLSLPQARQLAVAALRQGQPKLAYSLAQGLLKADHKSSFAHFTLANAQGLLGQATPARKSAARAYRFADTKLRRFEAAELAARLSFAEERPTLTQLWLRRAVQNAPNTKVEEQLGKDYGQLRAINPFSFSIRGGLRPSSNVNGGSNTAVQIIDGIPATGMLSGSAQALSGTVATLDTALRYRLRGTKRSRTEIASRLYVKRVFLTGDAKVQAPDVENSDLSSTYAELRLDHSFALGDKGNAARLGAAIGQFWYGGDKNFDFLSLNAGHSWQLSKRTKVTVDTFTEGRKSDVSSQLDRVIYGFATGLKHARQNGDKLSFGLNLRKTESDFRNARYTSATFSAKYAFANQFGPAKITTGIAAAYSDYPDYFAVVPVPGGRQDKSIYANINFLFVDADYAGFAPNLRVTAGRKFSNVSRFETEELSVSLGIQSKF